MLLGPALAFLASQPGMPRQAPAIVSDAAYGTVLVIVMLFMPGGLLPALPGLAVWAQHRGGRARSSPEFIR